RHLGDRAVQPGGQTDELGPVLIAGGDEQGDLAAADGGRGRRGSTPDITGAAEHQPDEDQPASAAPRPALTSPALLSRPLPPHHTGRGGRKTRRRNSVLFRLFPLSRRGR